ncbi:hypothetical protein DYB32_010674 [Aphanomyces invadans]|uniref:Doublecortin domain-containing protein n=1 Tax=Aphanomyces invadans TaxID=157072 RepID=A0A3R6VNV7_9STRA|nr:hypothetical protein DYB32_010674 [Aphanomyces invadans]
MSKIQGMTVQVGPDQAKTGQALAAYLSTVAALGYHGDRVYKATGVAVTAYDQLVEQEHVYVAAPGQPFVAPHPESVEEASAAAVDGATGDIDVKTPIVVTFWNKFDAPVDVYWFDTHIYNLDANETQRFHGLHGDLLNADSDAVFEQYVDVSHGHEQEFHVPGGIEIEFRNHFESEPVDIYWFDTAHAHLPPQSKISLHANDGDEFTLVDSDGAIVATHVLTEADGPIQFLAVPLEVHDQLPEHEEL